ncbi:3-hydroxyacyl-CoA dehydrogenase family protein [Olivibacter sp. SDN3]|uniref:3-hydroxyacyl-CoA dehydrogenase family protein n=1 Tax=Olivibacter sp. SDN3 TaxID=2764720 RepID=UPI0016510B26|nr:3-hydroxyacyl-CoA dehydrogenase family protein [Olivibacter sp. SDN3]QNL51547.1 3-hydroxyacyl-CoA dehydrogenase family protein [Olivibacter sp. SDN3]
MTSIKEQVTVEQIQIGIVGLGLMGCSIVVSLLKAGHPVVAIAPVKGEEITAAKRIYEHLEYAKYDGLLDASIDSYLGKLMISTDYNTLGKCALVVECVIEREDIKQIVYDKVASIVAKDTIIASNTSAIPISRLQQYIAVPERFLGVHWAEPAYTTRFLEITCGQKTSLAVAEWVYQLAGSWDKEPTLLQKDIRGFITNRLMYAVYREALHLVATDATCFEDADKAFRYDLGSWITLMGLFRRMDFLGLQDYALIFEQLFPLLYNGEEVPGVMERMVDLGAKGVQNLRGFYSYDESQAKAWIKAFHAFNQTIYQQAAQYPESRLEHVLASNTYDG